MKKTMLLFVGLLVSGSAMAASAAPEEAKLMECSFQESMSVSFGFASVYTFTGSITDASSGLSPFYEINGPVQVSVADTASTNFPAKQVASTTAQLNNHPWGSSVLMDVTSTEATGAAAFRILVFPGAANSPSGTLSAYKMNTLTGNGLAGSCTSVDSRLLQN